MKSIYSLVGMQYRGTERLVWSLPRGEPLRLVREPGNEYDRNAIQVWARGQLVAFIKSKEAVDLARQMDGRGLTAIAGTMVVGEWPRVEIDDAVFRPARSRGIPG